MGVPTEVWLPIATLVLGYCLNLMRDWLRDRRRRLREKDAHEFRLRARTEARKAAFQRRTLDELHEAVQHHYKTFKNPEEEIELHYSWLNILQVSRMNILSLATAIGDAELISIIKDVCSKAEGLEEFVSGRDEFFSEPEYREMRHAEIDDLEKALQCLYHHVMNLKRECA